MNLNGKDNRAMSSVPMTSLLSGPKIVVVETIPNSVA